jgi:allophanate hydrolase
MDVLLLPTAPTIYKVIDMQADPVRLNSNLGRYTNFVNLLDCSAIAVPAGFRPDGLPGGVTLVAPAFCDDALAALGQRLHQADLFGMGCYRKATG